MLKETSSSRKIKLVPEDTKFLASFVGELNGNIKLLEENLSVKIFQNGNKISIKGEKNKLDHAEHIIKTLYASCCNGSDISKETIYLATNNNIFSDSKEMQIIKTPRKQIKPRTKNQETFVKMIDEGIIDPVLVTKSALKNAVSVALTVMSADCVISNIRIDEGN